MTGYDGGNWTVMFMGGGGKGAGRKGNGNIHFFLFSRFGVDSCHETKK